jgi:hypothetical protein
MLGPGPPQKGLHPFGQVQIMLSITTMFPGPAFLRNEINDIFVLFPIRELEGRVRSIYTLVSPQSRPLGPPFH